MSAFKKEDIKICKELILDLVRDNSAFSNFILSPTVDHWYDFFNEENYEGFRLYCGASKGVIIFDDYDFVIKMPLIDRDEAFDYCLLEWRNYLHFKEIGLDRFFAEIDYVDKIGNTPIYIQEFVDCNEEEIEDEISEASYNNAVEVARHFGEEITEDWNNAFWDDFFDLDSFDKAEIFLRESWGDDNFEYLETEFEDNYINDLHCGNFGYRGDFLVVVDYSGYGFNDLQNSKEWYKACESSHPGFKFERRN